MNKPNLHHLQTKLRWLKPWYFLVIAVISGVICVSALRSNNEHMVVLRQAVYSADQNDTNVQQALTNLQAYVTSHMNTNLNADNSVYPPIQLKYTYQRLVDAESQNVSQTNSQLYTNAQNYCQQQDSTDFSGRNRVPCIEQYVETHDASLATIPASLYEFDFVSPSWSPDLAGWSLIATVLSVVLFVASWATSWWLKRSLR